MLFTEIMKNNKDFSRAFKKGRYVACREVVCYFVKNKLPCNRLGITAGKKIGGAVQRNRAKRVIRAAYRLREQEFPIGYDLVVVARAELLNAKTQDLEEFFHRRLIAEINKQASLPDKQVRGKKVK